MFRGEWMRLVGRLLCLLAVVFPLTVVAAGVASGSVGSATGGAVQKCRHWKDDMQILPGVTHTPTAQTVHAHGRLFGCDKAGGAALFTATMHMRAATCDDLTTAGVGKFAWLNGQTSNALLFFTQQPLEPAKVFVTGKITSGVFKDLFIEAWLRYQQVFTGTGPGCSPTNPLKKISFTNTQSYRLFEPTTTTTTIAPHHTTTTQHHTSTSHTSTSVPVTGQGSTTTFGRAGSTSTAGVVGITLGPPPTSGGSGLAFTGNGQLGAILGIEAAIVGAALACAAPDRRRRGFRIARRRPKPRAWARVTLPPQ